MTRGKLQTRASSRAKTVPVTLSIAGSDSGGGAGIQADLKTFEALGTFGTTAITCVTAQNPTGVTGITALSSDMVRRQIEAVCTGFPVAAVKTGMLYSRTLIETVAEAAWEFRFKNLVLDPVMIATSGARLLRENATRALLTTLAPMATVLTPNLPEAEVLADMRIRSEQELSEAARNIVRRTGSACVVKGGHLAGLQVVDVLCVGQEVYVFRGPRRRVKETHGTGCAFSAALTAGLAQGRPLPEAVARAKAFVDQALRQAQAAGRHWPLRFSAVRSHG